MTNDIRLKSISFMNMDDGIHVCPTCHVQIGEGEDHCLNCALCESEYEIEALKEMLNELIDANYGIQVHHIGDGDGLSEEMADKVKVYWQAHLGRKRD